MRINQSWSPQEDKLLSSLVLEYKNKNCWAQIAERINQTYPGRTRFGKQCRDRFINHIKIQESSNTVNIWTTQQTLFLISMYKQMGSKWTQISKKIPGKSENCVKNKFYGSLRKAVRSLNMQFRSACQKSKKQMRFKSIMRVLEYAEGRYRMQPALMSKSVKLREILLEMTINQQISISDEEVMKLVSEINDFSIAIRSYKVVKIPKNCPIEGDSIMGSDQIYMQDNELKQTAQKTCCSGKSQEDQMQLVGSLNKQNDNSQAKILSGEYKKQNHEEQNKHLADLIPLSMVDDNEKINKWEQMLMDHFFSQPHSPLDSEEIF